MIEVRNLTVSYGENTARGSIRFKWKNGQKYGICGKSNAGKTALLDHLAGACPCEREAVLINGFDMNSEPMKAREFIGYVPKESALYPDMTPVEYLMYVADVKGMGYEKAIRTVSNLLDVTGVSPRRDCLIANLSSVEKRCIAIAQAVLGKSDILIFDDPWHGLSARDAQKITELVQVVSEGATVIVSARNDAELQKICDAVFLLEGGVLNEITVSEKEDMN